MPSPAETLTTAPEAVLTPELAARLLAGAATGMFMDSVAEGCGISPDILQQWLTMGLSRGAVEPYRSFARQYRAQEKVPQLDAIAAIRTAAAVDANIALKFLAVRYPSEYGPKAKPKQAGDLQPSEQDEAAEEAMVDQLIETMPPVLRRLLEKRGIRIPD